VDKEKHIMNNIYRVIDRNSGEVIAEGFAKRELAKPARDEAIANRRIDAAVCRGTDHPLGPTTGAFPVKTKTYKRK
jgi:hypothetical protein